VIDDQYVQQQTNVGDAVVVFPMTVKDKDGNVYQVEKITETDSNGKTTERVVATFIGNAGTPLAAGSFDPAQLDGSKALVRFSKGDGYYALDEWEPYYDGVLLIRDKYQKLYDNYYAPWKMLPSGKKDNVTAVIEVKDASIDPKQVKFMTPQGTTFQSVYDSLRKEYRLTIVSGPAGDVQEIYALHP